MNPVKYPFITSLLNEARLYAIDSIGYTYNYEGWEDEHKKQERIMIGKFGQIWVAEFCRLNQIPYIKDSSSPKQADNLDLIIYDRLVDVKTTVIPEMVGQVNAGIINKECDEYCFLITDKKCSYIQPVGFVCRNDYLKYAIFVKKGDIIPGTTIMQRFNKGSYFLPPDCIALKPFVQWLIHPERNTKHQFFIPEESIRYDNLQKRIKTLEQQNNNMESRENKNHEIKMMLLKIISLLSPKRVNRKESTDTIINKLNDMFSDIDEHLDQ